MKTISVAVSNEDYEAFREAAGRQQRPIAQLIRDAMAFYRQEQLNHRSPLRDIPVLAGHRPTGPLPTRSETYDEVFGPDEP